MTTEPDVIDDDPGTDLDVRQPPGTLFRTDDPTEIVARATATADALMNAVRAHDAGKPKEKRLISVISGKEFPKVEAWTLLGTMLGVFPVVVWTREITGGWEARVEAHTLSGAVVGAAEAICENTEQNWKGRPSNALKSMAQTRATSKALRGPLGFVMTLAGLEATPAEEIPVGGPTADVASVAQPAANAAKAASPTETPVRMKDKRQNAAIHALVAEIGLSDSQYRQALKDTYGVESSNDLTYEQAEDLVVRLREAKRLAGVS